MTKENPSAALLLDRTAVARFLSLSECIAAVERGFAAHANGRALGPAIAHVDGDGGEFHVKCGGLRGDRAYFACKVNGGFFNNRAVSGLPNIMGLILLSDASSGRPLAVMESGFITRLRTGAATAVAASYLARPQSSTVTICGAGMQAEIQLRALMQVLRLRQAWIWARSDSTAFAERLTDELGIRVQATADLHDAGQQSDVIVTCTPSRSWILGREHVRPGTFIAAVGADSPDKQEIQPELMAQSSVVCDLAQQCAEVGDLHHAIAANRMRLDDIRGELGGIIVGRSARRLDNEETIIFDSTGTAIQDAAAAMVVYEAALLAGYSNNFKFCD